MTFIAITLSLKRSKKKLDKRSYRPSGTIVVVNEDGDAMQYLYGRKKLLELCEAYYMQPGCYVVVDPILPQDESSRHVRFAYEELGFVLGCASASKLKFKIIYKKTYYRYFGLSPDVGMSAYSYCFANYPEVRMLYTVPTIEEADRGCATYLMAQFLFAKKNAVKRWYTDLDYIIDTLDNGTEEFDV